MDEAGTLSPIKAYACSVTFFMEIRYVQALTLVFNTSELSVYNVSLIELSESIALKFVPFNQGARSIT